MRKPPIALILFVLSAAVLFACFNIEFAPTFQADHYPADYKSLLAGNPGVIRPGFYHFPLFISYRYMTNLGLTETEKRSLAPGYYSEVVPYDPNPPRYGYDHWLAKVSPGEYRQFSGYYKPIREGSHQYFLNCPEEAYETAAKTFEERSRQFGPESEPVKLWLEAQKQVFSNCGGGSVIPAKLGEGADPVIRSDREYQIACAYFYSGGFDEAAKRFERIAANSSSSWSRLGRYLAARCYIRKGTLVEGLRQFDHKSLDEARARLELVVADPQLNSLLPSARGLLDYIELRNEPQKYFPRVARIVTAPKPGEAIRQAWIDFDYLFDRGFKPESENDLWTWLSAMRGQGNSLETSLERWKATNASHWLVAALGGIKADHPQAGELVEAAVRLPQSSPAYLTVTYYRLRLALENGREREVVSELDRLLNNTKLIPSDSRNLFLALRFRFLTSFDDFLKYAPRQPISKGFRGAREDVDQYLDTDSLLILNSGLPLSLLEEAVKRPTLPLPIRQELALSAWSRALLIGERQAAMRLGVKVKEYWPELKEELARYEKAEDAASRRFSFVWTLLQYPGIQPYLRASLFRATGIHEIDTFRENWWCAFHDAEPMHEAGYVKRSHMETRRNSPEYIQYLHSEGVDANPSVSFLTQGQKQAASQELARLRQIPGAPDLLGEETLKWARAHPKDPRVPQALHLAVRATRFGCESEKTTGWSRRVFQYLHRNYPTSEWAKATPYYY